MKFIKQKSFDDIISAQELLEIIEDIVDKKIKQLKFPKYQVATVTNVSGSLINVQIPESTNEITSLKNKTGETLNIGDEVYILSIKGSLNNSIVSIKK